MEHPRRAYFVRSVILAVLYVCAGKAGLSLALEHSSVSPVWPPTGLSLAALLLLGVGHWPAIFIGSLIVNVTTPGVGAGVASVIAMGNTLEAALGAELARRFACNISCFRQVPGIFRFIFFAAIPSTVLSAVVGVWALRMGGLLTDADSLAAGLTWWTGNLVSDLVIAPLLVIWLSAPAPRYPRLRIIEAFGLLLAIVGSGLLVFGPWNSFGGMAYPVMFLVLPSLLWAAYRFKDRGAVTASAVLSALAIVATLQGYGPFVLPNPNDSLVLLQLFVGVNAISMLVLAALVSDRTRSADNLEESQRRLLMALEAGRMGTWDWDLSSGRVHWSASLERMHGLEPGTFAGTFEAFIQDVHPDDRRRVQEQVGQSSQGTREHHVQYRLLLKDGAVRYVEGRGQLVRDRDGNPAGMIGICVDVTEQKLGEQEREGLLERERVARAEAERANQAKDNFLAVLSHELRTPLTPVLLTASLLENDPNLPASMRADIQMIRRNVEMEARLIDDLLDLTRITRGKLQLDLQPADLHEIIHRALDICFRGSSVKVTVELNARQARIHADAGRIQQVLWNLLNNARKFTPSDGTITVRSSNPDEQSIRVEVSDTGAGIPPEAIPKLFQAFEQGDSLEAKRAGGLGLGLAISRALVAGHGGTLTASSEGPGKGSTFTVQFMTAASPTSPPPTNGEPPPRQRKARILLVEDNDITLKALRRLLVDRQHQVVEATTIAAARELASREPLDLVISDLGLPDGMGYEMMRELGKLYGVRGIAISGYGMPSDIDQSRKAGFVEHLVKPVDAAALDSAIARALESEQPVSTHT